MVSGVVVGNGYRPSWLLWTEDLYKDFVLLYCYSNVRDPK